MINEYRIKKEDFENNFIKFKEYFFDAIQADCDAGFREDHKSVLTIHCYNDKISECNTLTKDYELFFFENIFYEYDYDDFQRKFKEFNPRYCTDIYIKENLQRYLDCYNAINNISEHFISTTNLDDKKEYNIVFYIKNVDLRNSFINIADVKSFVEIDKYSEVTTTYNKDVVIPEDYDHSFENDGGLLVEDKIFKYLDNIYNKKNK